MQKRAKKNERPPPVEERLDKIEEQIKSINTVFVHLQFSLAEVRKEVRAANIAKVAREAYGEDLRHMRNTQRDVMKTLRLLREKGLITREELTEALSDG